MDYPQIDIPETLVPPNTIFYPPVAEVPYLDPVLLTESGTGRVGTWEGQKYFFEEETSSSNKEEININTRTDTKQPATKPQKNTSTEEGVATFNIPFINYEFPVPSPEVIASSVIASGVSATAAIGGSMILQSVVNQLKKVMTKIFKKVLKKEIADKKK